MTEKKIPGKDHLETSGKDQETLQADTDGKEMCYARAESRGEESGDTTENPRENAGSLGKNGEAQAADASDAAGAESGEAKEKPKKPARVRKRPKDHLLVRKYGKRLYAARKAVEERPYLLEEALELVKKGATAKFDETVEVSFNCNVDPKKADQNVRGVVQLPEGTGKVSRVAVFARDAAAKEARDAGADIVGAEDLAEKIQGGFLEFDRCVATPDMMVIVGKLGKILGPRGLMPNPRTGSVTAHIGEAVRSIKGGQVTFRVDKEGVMHALIGKASFSVAALEKNFRALWDALLGLKPASLKKDLVERAFLSSTMGPSVLLDHRRI